MFRYNKYKYLDIINTNICNLEIKIKDTTKILKDFFIN